MMQRLRAGLAVAILGLMLPASVSPIAANDTIDPVVTGAIQPGVAMPAAIAKGSPEFRATLATLLADDPMAAFLAAGKLGNDVERRTIQWAAIYFNAGKVDYRLVEAFAIDAPEFAAPNTYRMRIEQALTGRETPPEPAEVLTSLGTSAAPQTVDGQIRLAIAYLETGDTDKATSLARAVWIDNFLTETQEAEVLDRLGGLIDRESHWKRAMHLMMYDRAKGSERLIPFLTDAQKSLVVARAAVSRRTDNAKALLDAVDATMQANPVFIYSRAQRARQFELWQSAVDWLDKAPAGAPDAAEWWYERRTLVRKLLDVGEPALAYRAAAGYTEGPEGRLVDARFHSGWIALSFLSDAAAAKAHFTGMAELATLPDTVSQANYWLARANLTLGDVEAAREAFTAAARYGTVYYGQLARAELGEAGVDIRPLPAWQQSQSLFDADPVVRAVRLLAANGQATMAVPLLRYYGSTLSKAGDLLLAARLAQEIGADHLAVAIATSADQQGMPLDAINFPKAGVPETAELATEHAAVYAVVRQESMFQVDAVSSAGARGLMQLMPGTAKDVARDVGVDYSPSRLVSDPEYNALLGSTYLRTQLDRYDGSLVLAAAAYNAGPGNANKWIAAYGDPRQANVDPVIWVELIPFQETRTYVKRVLGNYLVYREQLGGSRVTLQQALRSIE